MSSRKNSQCAAPKSAVPPAEGDLDAATRFISSFYRTYETEDCVGHCLTSVVNT